MQGVDVQKLANGIISVMSYTVAPDVTASSLSIDNSATASADVKLSQFGGGFTWSKGTPLYLEGNAAHSRFDPVFVASDGAVQQRVPVKWNTFTGSAGTAGTSRCRNIGSFDRSSTSRSASSPAT